MHTKQSLTALLFAVSLSACGATTPPARTGTETVRIAGNQGAGMNIRMATANEAIVRTVPVPIASAWSAMPEVYDSLGIALGRRDAAAHVIGNPNFSLRRHLKNVPLRRYLDCGQTQIDANADTYQINMSILTELRARPDGATDVITIIDARGRSIQFSGEWIRCTSTGALEQRLVEQLTILLQR